MGVYGSGIIDWAIPVWLPDGKRYGTNSNELVVNHSLEARYRGKYGLSTAIREMATHYHELSARDKATVIGALESLYWAWDEPERPWTAWHTTTFYEGFVVQHAPLSWLIAHGHDCNPQGTGHEAEGRAPEPLTDAQVTSMIRLYREMGEWSGRTYARDSGTMREHRECGNTACPGGRYAPLYRQMAKQPEGNDMSAEDRDRLARLERIVGGWGQIEDPLDPDASAARIEELDDQNVNILLALSNRHTAQRPINRTVFRMARIIAGWGQMAEPDDDEAMMQRIAQLDDQNVNVLLALSRTNSAVLQLQEAVEQLADDPQLDDVTRTNIRRHAAAILQLVEGQADDPLAGGP